MVTVVLVADDDDGDDDDNTEYFRCYSVPGVEGEGMVTGPATARHEWKP